MEMEAGCQSVLVFWGVVIALAYLLTWSKAA